MKFFSQLVAGFLALAAYISAYPSPIDTTPAPVWLRAYSFDNFDGRALQLRTQPDGRQIVVIDAISPAFWSNFTSGTIRTVDKTSLFVPYYLGPVSYLRNVSITSTGWVAEFYFKNATKTDPPAPPNTAWYLTYPQPYGVYQIRYYSVPLFYGNGFAACERPGYWQIYYYAYQIQLPSFLNKCAMIDVQTTVAPFDATIPGV